MTLIKNIPAKHTNPVARFEAEEQGLLSPVLQTCFTRDKAIQIPHLGVVLTAGASEEGGQDSKCRQSLFVPGMRLAKLKAT